MRVLTSCGLTANSQGGRRVSRVLSSSDRAYTRDLIDMNEEAKLIVAAPGITTKSKSEL